MKPKVVLKGKTDFPTESDGFTYSMKSRGDEGLCFVMAIGYLAETVAQNNISVKETLEQIKKAIKDAKEEMEEK